MTLVMSVARYGNTLKLIVGSFPDGQSARNLAAARLRHIADTAWSTKRDVAPNLYPAVIGDWR